MRIRRSERQPRTQVGITQRSPRAEIAETDASHVGRPAVGRPHGSRGDVTTSASSIGQAFVITPPLDPCCAKRRPTSHASVALLCVPLLLRVLCVDPNPRPLLPQRARPPRTHVSE